MKTTLACIALVLVHTFHGQLVSAQEETPKPTEDPPIDAVPPSDEVSGDQENMSLTNSAVESLSEEVSGDQESDIAESDVSSFPSYGSIYGSYNPRRCCWNNAPRSPILNIGSMFQSEDVRRNIEYMLSKNEAVKQAVSKNAMNCERSHWGSEGLSDNCQSSYHRATEVRLYGRKCYIVRPNQQCVTYRRCNQQSPCADSNRRGENSSPLHDVISRRNLPTGGDPCRRTSMSSSTCLPDGYRTFQVWIYCDFCGFKLINMELPQCCSCKRYSRCRR